MKRFGKDFGRWQILKSNLQNKSVNRYFKEREIWWVALGCNIGSEEDGKGKDFGRPVIILRKFNQQLFWGVPLTTTHRKGKYYMHFSYIKNVMSVAILSQLRAYDSKRLLYRDGYVNTLDFTRLQLGLILIIKQNPYK